MVEVENGQGTGGCIDFILVTADGGDRPSFNRGDLHVEESLLEDGGGVKQMHTLTSRIVIVKVKEWVPVPHSLAYFSLICIQDT